MIPVSFPFAVFAYFLGAFFLVTLLAFLLHARKMDNWRWIMAKGRNPFVTCPNCRARYVDSRGGSYTSCPRCSYVIQRDEKSE